ncbi:unnamed protein product [Durusdinium trenchii]|uniref:Exostosin GT47 domain-containing protein n=3 Tax=Durusdinium trenchii TaxID=1381693 RepID=A0ABP0PAF3_9DINO
MVPNNPIRMEIYNQLESIKGSKVVLQTFSRTDTSSLPTAKQIGATMRRSVFCICPPAENTAAGTKRLYDAILSGCIPVVIRFPTIWGSGVSWWRVDGAPLEWAMPFPSKIDWHRLVVEVPEDELLKNSGLLFSCFTTNIEDKQKYLMEVRELLLYDLAGGHRDAFSLLLEGLRMALPRLYKASWVRPLVCEPVRVIEDTSHGKAVKGWSNSFGQISCDALEFWQRPSKLWLQEQEATRLEDGNLSVSPIMLSYFVFNASMSLGSSGHLATYVHRSFSLRPDLEHHAMSKFAPFLTCVTPEFPKALHFLNASAVQKSQSYQDLTGCRAGPQPRPTDHQVTGNAWPPFLQIVFPVCQVKDLEDLQHLSHEIQELWDEMRPDARSPRESFQVVAYKTCVDGTHGTPLDLSQLARVILVLWRHR